MDQTADKNGVELVRLSGLYDFPEFVKKASIDDIRDDSGELPSSVFADPVTRRFPCHSKAAAWVSAAFFFDKKASFQPREAARLEDRLERMAAHWGIAGDVGKLKQQWQAHNQDAFDKLADDDFAFVWTDDEAKTKQRHLPLRNALEVKAAADWLYEHRDAVPYCDRRVIATKVLEKAAQFGAGVTERLEFLDRQAGRGVCDPDRVVTMLQNRALLCKNAAHRTAIETLAAEIRKSPKVTLQFQSLVKLAETVDMIDRSLGLAGKYTELIPRPEDVIFEGTFTKASEERQGLVETASGNVYSREELKKLALDDIQAAFGSEFAREIARGLDVDLDKLAEQAPILPLPDAELFDNVCRAAGVRPQLRKAASAGRGPSREQLHQLASLYQ